MILTSSISSLLCPFATLPDAVSPSPLDNNTQHRETNALRLRVAPRRCLVVLSTAAATATARQFAFGLGLNLACLVGSGGRDLPRRRYVPDRGLHAHHATPTPYTDTYIPRTGVRSTEYGRSTWWEHLTGVVWCISHLISTTPGRCDGFFCSLLTFAAQVRPLLPTCIRQCTSVRSTLGMYVRTYVLRMCVSTDMSTRGTVEAAAKASSPLRPHIGSYKYVTVHPSEVYSQGP